MTPRVVSEAAFQQQVTQTAQLLGWHYVHFRPGRTATGWRTPVSGPLGEGWPDLVLARERDGRLIFAELKSRTGKVSPKQRNVLDLLAAVGGERVEVHVWRVGDLERVRKVLR